MRNAKGRILEGKEGSGNNSGEGIFNQGSKNRIFYVKYQVRIVNVGYSETGLGKPANFSGLTWLDVTKNIGPKIDH